MKSHKYEVYDKGVVITDETNRRSLANTTIVSRYRYKTNIKDENGTWLETIKLFDDNGQATNISTNGVFTGDDDYDTLVSDLLTTYIRDYAAGTTKRYLETVKIVSSYIIQGKSLAESLKLSINNSGNNETMVVIRKLSRLMLLNDIGDITYQFNEEVQEIVTGSAYNQYMRVHLFDEDHGPFLKEEMSTLRKALDNPYIHLEDRVVLGLFIELGLRPIQLILIKQSDFSISKIENTITYSIKIPRVKQGTDQRRQLFTTRILTRNLGEMIDDLINIHQIVFSELNIKNPPLIMRRYKLFERSPYKIHNKEDDYLLNINNKNWTYDLAQDENPYFDIYKNNNKEDMAHHISRANLQYRLDCIVPYLQISPRTKRPFNLNAYRFRYTLGTYLVQEGYTQAEVASALDHSTVDSVRHYFRDTPEVCDLIEHATNLRIEQSMFVAAWKKTNAIENNIYGDDIVETRAFTVIGKCSKGSACYLEPAIACYSCDLFCPNKETKSHENALSLIEDRIDYIKKTSSGAAVQQLDNALTGCHAAIAYSRGDEVLTLAELKETSLHQDKIHE